MNNQPVNPWAVDPALLGVMLANVAEHPDVCACVDCTFINLIPSMLDAEGVEPR